MTFREGEEWWQASDDKWYPPELHPNHVEATAGAGPSGTKVAAIVGVLAALVIGAVYWLGAGDDDPAVATVATEPSDGEIDDGPASETVAETDPGAEPQADADAETDPGGEPQADAGAETDPGGEPQADADADADPVPSPEPVPDGLTLATDGLGLVRFGDKTGAVVEALTAELGPITFDSRWTLLDHDNPDGDGFADDPDNPSVTFDFPQYRHLCWGDLVMLCTIHGRVEAPGDFVGWEQAHRGAFAHGNDLVGDAALGTTAGGLAVGSPAAELVAAGEAELRAGVAGTLLFGGTFSGRLVGEWPAGSARPDAADQAIQCIEAGTRLQPTARPTCMVSIADSAPVNTLARTVLRAAIHGDEISFVATRVPNGPTAESGFSPFDGSAFLADLAVLEPIEEPFDIRGAADLVPDADPGLGGNSCSFPGDVTVQCTYRIVHPDGIDTVVLSYQGTGFVSAAIN